MLLISQRFCLSSLALATLMSWDTTRQLAATRRKDGAVRTVQVNFPGGNGDAVRRQGFKKAPRTPRGEGSILAGEYDRQHAGSLRRVGRVFRAELHLRLIVIDFEKELAAGECEAAEVMLLVGIIVGVELGESLHSPDQHGLHFRGERVDAGGQP